MWIEQTKGFRKHDTDGHDQTWLDVNLSFIMLIYWIKLSIDQSMYWVLCDCKRLEYIFEMSFFPHLAKWTLMKGKQLKISYKKNICKKKSFIRLKVQIWIIKFLQ